MATYIEGIESILFIKHLGTWAPISCENSHTFQESSDMIGTTTRDNAGWKTSRPTEQNYSMSVNASVVLENSSSILSYFEIRKKKRDGELIAWKRETADGLYIDMGLAYITDISNVMSSGELATFTLTLQGFGTPDYVFNEIGDLVPLLSDAYKKLLSDNNDVTLTTN